MHLEKQYRHVLFGKGSSKGIFAADESGPMIARRFKTIGVESTGENRRVLMLAAPRLGEFVSGVILHEETLGQCTEDGMSAPIEY